MQSCPAIPAGPGQVITATFKHASADVIDLVLSDYPVSIPHSGLSVLNPPTTDPTSSPETIGVTENHPFWSVDRAEFVQVGELAIGERLQTLSGDTKWVQQKLPRPGPEPVYNLEIHGEHVYYVGTDGVLAHNACPPYKNKYPDDPHSPVQRFELRQVDGKWKTFDAKGNSFTARGNYNYVVIDGRIFVTKVPSQPFIGQRVAGHIDIARGRDVTYAGEIRFGAGRGNRGKIQWWNNQSGHYQPDASYANSVEHLLPINLFRNW